MHCLHQSCTHYGLMGGKKRKFLHLSKRPPRTTFETLWLGPDDWGFHAALLSVWHRLPSNGLPRCNLLLLQALQVVRWWPLLVEHKHIHIYEQTYTSKTLQQPSSLPAVPSAVASAAASAAAVWSCSRIVINMEIQQQFGAWRAGMYY